MTGDVVPVRVSGESVEILDQTALPHEERYLPLATLDSVCEAIRELRIRGAPLLGIAGAFGMAIAASTGGASDTELRAAAAALTATRPTAVDLGRAAGSALEVALACPEPERAATLWRHAREMLHRQRETDLALADRGASLLAPGSRVLTHCNTGALATGGLGTALAVIRLGHERGLVERCFATETRPLLQGARLTTWELVRAGVPVTLLPDSAAASLLLAGGVDAVITGADRVAANGDAANKVGTLGLALAAERAGIPFYVAAPTTTVDLACPGGASIPIEFRRAEEVGGFGGHRWAPEDIDAYNPAFDVTPGALIAAIVTERGIARPPYEESLRRLAGGP